MMQSTDCKIFLYIFFSYWPMPLGVAKEDERMVHASHSRSEKIT